MTILLTTANNQCPNCSAPVQRHVINESCILAPSDVPASPAAILSVCICPTELQSFLEGNTETDPCHQCSHNQFIEDPGTFMGIKQLGEQSWVELHKCPNCNTSFALTDSNSN